MDEILQRYKQGKFQKCVELIKLLPESDDLVQNLALENSLLVCESLVTIAKNDVDEILEVQEHLYLFFDRVTSLGMVTKTIPFELKLTATFNFVWWLLFYVDNELNEREVEEYLKLTNKGIVRVLGIDSSSGTSSNASENIINNLYDLKSFMSEKDHTSVLLILEFVIVVILYVVKLRRTSTKKCAQLVRVFVEDLKLKVKSVESMNEFLNVKPLPLCLFKFGLNKMATLVSELNSNVTDYFYLLESVLLYLLEDFKGSLKSLQKNINSSVKSLWNYLGVLNSFNIENWDLCLGFLNRASSLVIEANLKARFLVMHGNLERINRNHKEALKHFESALSLCPKCPAILFYIGQQHGKMGLYDFMVDNFEKLVEAVTNRDFESDLKPNFETVILDWIHPYDEVTEIEALYALATSYGLNERFHKAAETFEKIVLFLNVNSLDTKNGIIQVPHSLTIYHEASIMNLMSGNLVRAEQIALDAIDLYIPEEPTTKDRKISSFSTRDVSWLQKLINQELLECDLEPKELKDEVIYPEDVVYFLPQNVVALLILSEIQRIQEVDEYKATLSKVLSVFSKYLASMQKKEVVTEDEKYVWTLVKALAGKTCLRIADVLMESQDAMNIEKMFKRALSCNKGDKDALYNYYRYLLKAGKSGEAFRLWHTFHAEETTITEESVQSFSLRYFLIGKISKREIEKIERETEFTDVKIS